jgi:hypothetical protein
MGSARVLVWFWVRSSVPRMLGAGSRERRGVAVQAGAAQMSSRPVSSSWLRKVTPLARPGGRIGDGPSPRRAAARRPTSRRHAEDHEVRLSY